MDPFVTIVQLTVTNVVAKLPVQPVQYQIFWNLNYAFHLVAPVMWLI
jgi:hypothetical protein